MNDLRFAVLGAGFWTRFQLSAWRELPGTRCIAIYNRTGAKAEALARDFGIPAVYDDAEALIRREKPDFLDIVTDPGTHSRFVLMAAAHRTPVICQKPMAPSLDEAQEMVCACREARVPFFVHENWRWQAPMREAKAILEGGRIGRPFRARLQFSCSFPVFDNQPFLKKLDRFILTDIGSHVLDTARFLFGEARSLFGVIRRVRRDIRGEDVATVTMKMESGAAVTCEMSYASRTEHERFPQTYLFAEGDEGSLALGPDYEIRTTTKEGTQARRVPPPHFAWADPAYDLVHASIVPCCADLLKALRGEGAAETTGEDNLKTARLVFASYESARTGKSIDIKEEER
jgi:predicted dehydrogenase